MRVLFAILFSVILLGNPAFSTAAVCPTVTACHCQGKMACCVKQSADSRIPSAPPAAPSVSSIDWQIIQPIIEHILVLDRVVSSRFSFIQHSASSVGIPLFQRNCVFLI